MESPTTKIINFYYHYYYCYNYYYYYWSAFKILTGTPTGKRSLGRPRRRWKDNIRIDLKEIGINTRNWVDLSQDREIGEPL